MRSFLIAMAVVLTVAALLIALAAARVAPLAARLQAWWMRRAGVAVTARPRAGKADGDGTVGLLAAMQGDSPEADSGDGGGGFDSGGFDGGGGDGG